MSAIGDHDVIQDLVIWVFQEGCKGKEAILISISNSFNQFLYLVHYLFNLGKLLNDSLSQINFKDILLYKV